MKNIFTFLLFTLLFQFGFSQTITVLDPNGGEVLHSCQQYNITWNTTGAVSDYYNIDYSLDGGIIWASVTSNYLSIGGDFLWTVPEVQSNTCLIRVKDALDATIIDQSDALFTINTPITLTSPNGGEVWQSGSSQTITWNSNNTSNTYEIHYSLNGGSTWVLIVNAYNTVSGTYNWIVPVVIPSSNCLIRVRDDVQNCMSDQSDNTFTITPPQPILTSPNGGELIDAGCNSTITWNANSMYSNVRLEYSSDNGVTWNLITNNTNNDGSQNWSPPANLYSTDYLIRISNYDDYNIFDISDNTFTVRNPLEMMATNPGDTVWGCSTFPITFRKASYCTSRINLHYSLDNGLTWILLYNYYSVYSSSNSRTINWSVPNNINSNQALFRVQDYYDNATFSESIDTFIIHPSVDITVTSPNGGEVFASGSNQLITWNNTTNVSGTNIIRFFNGSSWSNIATSVTGNAYNWTVPNYNESNCYIEVVDQLNTCRSDQSDNTFTITPPQPILTSPNGGELIDAGCNSTITWNANSMYSNVRLEYSSDNGVTWNLITNNTNNDGSQNWSPPANLYSTDYLIRISNYDDYNIFDISDNTFTVRNPLEMMATNPGDTVWGCSTFPITFRKASYCTSRINLHYSLDNGLTWILLYNYYSVYSSSNSRTINWSVPNNINSNQALFRVQDYYDNATFSESIDTFIIHPSVDITVTSPNSGEVFASGSNQLITWNNTTNVSGTYIIRFFNGSSWSNIATSVTGNAYNWTVPNYNESNCYIEVVDQLNTCRSDQSDNTFTITPPQPILTSPNGGELIDAGCNSTITWNANSMYSNVRLEYSSDNGVTWNLITNNTNNDGSQNWSPPANLYSTDYLIRISNYDDYNIFDISDNTFTVRNPLEMMATNPGDTVWGCSTFPITFRKASYCTSRINLHYSLDNGLTWILLYNYYSVYSSSNSRTINWSVPNNINSNQALFRVQDYYDNATFSESIDTFIIHPSVDITVTSPNGGEVFASGSNQLITWNNTTNVSGTYIIRFFNGSSWSNIATSVTGNAYNWTVPNYNESNCYIEVVDQLNTCRSDQSNNTFTITPPQPILTSPNGGELIDAGCNSTITWNANSMYSNVRLEYSSDNGVTWNLITNNTNNDGSQNWSPPANLYSTDYLIRISNYDDYNIFDISDNTFTVRNPLEMMATNPGDTVWGCSTFPITFRKASYCTSRINLHYSLDNGLTWILLYNYYSVYSSSNSRTINWSVPNNINSNQALFRVQDYYDNATFSESIDTFIIHPSVDITVTSPNGGEVFASGSNQLITWNNTTNVSGTYIIRFFNGSSWSNIATSVTGNAYNWTVPNYNESNCYIEVVDQLNTCRSDQSDNTFTITPPQPILTSPNGGELIDAGCNSTITWNANSMYSNVRLEYSSDNGVTWNLITNNTNNDGSQNWSPPANLYSTDYLIRISNYDDYNIFDISDNTFTVRNPLEMMATNPGDTVWGCSTFPITFRKASYCTSRINLHYSLDNGLTWILLYNYYSVYSSSNSRTINWSVPNNINSNQALFRVQDYYDNATFSESIDTFIIHPSVDITVTSPNGGEVFASGSNQLITWNNTTNVSGTYIIRFFNGSSWSNIATSVTGNAYNWTVPNYNESNCYIEVVDQLNTCRSDQSNNTFTITPPQPILTSPNGGEILYSQTNTTITWNANSMYSNVRLEYSIDNGLTWNLITNNTNNDGSFNWGVPEVSSTICLVRISNYGFPSLIDISDQVFEIRPVVTILTPNGDNGFTHWGGCTVTSITFDHSPAYNRWRIKYSINNGLTWTTINNNWYQTANPATYNWTMPNINSSDVLVSVEPYYNAAFIDESDSTFTVDQPVTIIQPNYGGIMQVGTNYDIIWISDGISNIYDIDFTTDNGSTWTNIITGYVTSTNTYTWNVPNTVSNNCRVRITDNIDNCKTHISDLAFIISTLPPPINLTTPNGLDTLSGCDDFDITWNETSIHGLYDISYSSDLGNTWIPIATNFATSIATYNWTLPNINSNELLIKVQIAGTSTYDLSDALFTIEPSTLEILTNDTVIILGTSIQLEATGVDSYLWTPNTFLNDETLSNPIATPNDTTEYFVEFINSECSLIDSVTIYVEYADSTIVEISSDTNIICNGESVLFTATPTNGGTSPDYQWLLNNNPVGTNSSTYTTSALNDYDEISVVLTSNQVGVINNIDTSDIIIISVNNNLLPYVTIDSDIGNTVCQNTNTTFTAIANNEGISPIYQWQVNNINVGTNSNTYASINLIDSDEVKVILTSSETCTSSNPVTSDTITMNVIPNTLASINISSSEGNSICENMLVDFTAVTTNEGVNPIYQWKVNGFNVGTNSSTYSTSNLVDADVVSVVLISDASCVTNSPINSNTIIMSVTEVTSPDVSISVLPSTTLCNGTNATFTAIAANVGASPSYIWKLNGTTVGSNNVSFSSSNLNDGDSLYVIINSSAICQTIILDTSSAIHLIVNSIPNQPIAINGDLSSCVNSSKTFTVNPVLGASSYTWTLPNTWTGTSNSNSINVTTGTISGNITVTANNSCGSSLAQTLFHNINATPIVTASSTDSTICIGESISLSGNGADSYTWSHGVTNNINFSPTVSTTYSVTGTNTNTCFSTADITITVNELPNVLAGNDTSVCENSTLVLNATGANSYSWNNGITNNLSFIVTNSDTYFVIGTNNNGCSNNDTLEVTMLSNPIVTTSVNDNDVCLGESIILNGIGADSYTWNFGVTNNTSFIPTNSLYYTVTGSLLNGCIDTAQIFINVNDLPVVVANADDISICIGESVILTGSGADTYSWNNSVLNNIAFNPPNTNTYTVTGIDNNGCSNTDNIIVTVNDLPSVFAGNDQTICENAFTTLSGSGANTYTWTNGILNNLAFMINSSNTYTVTGIDLNGCSNTDEVLVTMESLPIVTANTSDFSICNGNSLNLFGSGANSYSWNFGVINNAPFFPSNTLTYTVTGSSINGCIDTDEITIEVNDLPNVIASSSATNICAGESIILNGSGASNYTWTNGALNNIAYTPTVTTNFVVTGTDVNGCSNTDNVSVSVTNLPNVSAGNDVTVCENDELSLSGSGAIIYNWNNGVSNNIPFDVTSSDSYIVTGTAGNGCTNTDTIIVTMNPAPIVVANTTENSICEGNSLTLFGSGATSYTWDNSVIDNITFTPSTTETYTITGVNNEGCENTDEITIDVNPNPIISIVSIQDEISGNDGSIDIDVSNGTPTYTFDWNNDGIGDFDDTEDIENLTAGTYEIIVEDANLCYDTLTTIVDSKVNISQVYSELNSVILYPNPNIGIFKLKVLKIQKENIIIDIYSINGKLLKSETVRAYESELIIDLKDLTSGQYFIEMYTSEYRTIKRFTILK